MYCIFLGDCLKMHSNSVTAYNFIHSLESEVRSYSRDFPAEFNRAKGSFIYDSDGRRYIDMLSCCGSMNYGHNNDALKKPLLDYIEADSIAMSLDLVTTARLDFLDALQSVVLVPRGLPYRVQFPGPTGANAVEAAIKLARKVTGRHNVIAFTNAFHGCSLGALSLTASGHHRRASAALLGQVSRMPFDGYLGADVNTADLLEQMLDDPSSGVDAPAAILVETIQGEGGLHTASARWMQQIARIAERAGALLVIDDIQAGCGRSGEFFSFEALGVRPQIVTLAKSISGYGLPMSLVLLDPQLDRWAPGEHNGTFRGNTFAFVTAAAALRTFWADDSFAQTVRRKAAVLRQGLEQVAARAGLRACGRGMMQGLRFADGLSCETVRHGCFDRGLIIETCGPRGEVMKFLPALTMPEEVLTEALSIVGEVIDASPESARFEAARKMVAV
jgi:diaminobutyrate-2-oxoglutarate transaminase